MSPDANFLPESKLFGDMKSIQSFKRSGLSGVFTGQPVRWVVSSLLLEEHVPGVDSVPSNLCRARWWSCPPKKPTCQTSTTWSPLMMTRAVRSPSGRDKWWWGSCRPGSGTRRIRGGRWCPVKWTDLFDRGNNIWSPARTRVSHLRLWLPCLGLENVKCKSDERKRNTVD